MNRALFFWTGSFALVSLFCAGGGRADAAPPQPPAKSSAAKATSNQQRASTATRPATYSALRSATRKAKLVKARSAATAREMARTILPRYKVDANGDLVPDVRAAAAIIYDPETSQVLWEENSQAQRSIASITKVMTATVFLETQPDLMERVTITHADVTHASTTHLRANDRVTADDLLHLTLIASDNAAARALARISPYGSETFVARMNTKARELDLQSTAYADPAGLLSENVSSAYDMAKLITQASADERIASIMRTPEYTIYPSNRRGVTIRSTNHLLGRPDVDVLAGKTGFISKSGYCLATLLRLPQGGHEVAVVVLGAHSNAGRFLETQNLFSWMTTKASTMFAVRPPVPQIAQ